MIRLELDRVSKLCAATMLAVLAGCTGFGDRDPASPQPIRIGSGMWMVAARDDSTAVLIRHPVSAAEALVQGTQSADSAHTILYHSSGEVSEADIDSLILPVSDSTGGVAPAFAIVQADALRLAVIPGRSPALVQTPGKPDAHLFESVDGIWGIDADLLPQPITSRRVGIYDYVQLRSRQREGAVILYWATAPIWSPSGRIVAYATNREAVYRQEPGQSIWTIDLETGDEKPLVQENRRSFRPVGWLGEDVIFIGDMPGVWAADLETGARREVASSATFVDWARDGSAIAVAYGVPDSTRLQVIRERDGSFERTDLPGPPEGSYYLSDAILSPDGTRLLLTVLRDQTRPEHWVYDLDTGLADPIPPIAGTPTGRPSWVMDDAILVHVIIPESGLTEAWILPFHPADGLADLESGGGPTDPSRAPDGGIYLAVQPGAPGEAREYMQALIEGTLVLRESCVRLHTSSEATEYLVVWPPGYTVRERDRAILNERGDVFARVGDRVRLGGGETAGISPDEPSSSADAALPPFHGAPGCAGPFWIVGEVLPLSPPRPA